ncbi:MAG: hypothetical protein IJR54_07435, partial [Oscillibacter sp.]|nr:hypothetical protein [Oscillibacter sp.]
MKKYWGGILCALCLLLLTPGALAAETDAALPPDVAELSAATVASGPCGAKNAEDLIWILDENGTLTFIGSGAMANYSYYQPNGYNDDYATRAPWFSYRKDIKSVIIPEGVTRIGNYAFYGQGK